MSYKEGLAGLILGFGALSLTSKAYAEEAPKTPVIEQQEKTPIQKLHIFYQQFTHNRSVLPQLEATLEEVNKKRWTIPVKELDFVDSVKKDVDDYNTQFSIYEDIHKTLEEMLDKISEGKSIPGLYPKLSGIKRIKINKKLTSPYIMAPKQELINLMDEIYKAERDRKKGIKDRRLNATLERIEETKERKRKVIEATKNQMKVSSSSCNWEYLQGLEGWFTRTKGNLKFSLSAPDTKERGFLTYLQNPNMNGRMGIECNLKNLKFTPNMVIETRIYREREGTMTFYLKTSTHLESLYFNVPKKEWITISKKISGNVGPLPNTGKNPITLEPGAPYNRLDLIDRPPNRLEKGEKLYIDYIRIFPLEAED